MKYHIVGESLFTNRDYGNWIVGKKTENLRDADLVVFTGGEDVTPRLYDEPLGKHTVCNYYRDKYEKAVFKEAYALNKKILGICRGAQFLCVMSGGKLVQHQHNPHYLHWMRTIDNDRVLTTSTHHQAQYPWKMSEDEFKILAWTKHISPIHLNGNEKEIVNGVVEDDKEIEVAFYPKTQALCIQGHPELLFDEKHLDENYEKGIAYCRGLVEKLMNGIL